MSKPKLTVIKLVKGFLCIKDVRKFRIKQDFDPALWRQNEAMSTSAPALTLSYTKVQSEQIFIFLYDSGSSKKIDATPCTATALRLSNTGQIRWIFISICKIVPFNLQISVNTSTGN
jgi:hypothetical protein